MLVRLTILTLFLIPMASHAKWSVMQLSNYCKERTGYFVQHHESKQYACFLTDKHGRLMEAVDQYENIFVPERAQYDWRVIKKFELLNGKLEPSDTYIEGNIDSAGDGWGQPTAQASDLSAQKETQTSKSKLNTNPDDSRSPSSDINLSKVSSFEIDEVEELYKSACVTKKRFTSACCSDTEMCLNSQDYDNTDSTFITSMGKSYFQMQRMLKVTQNTMAVSGVTKGCESLKKLNQMGALVTASLTQLCDKGRRSCQATCSEVATKAKRVLGKLNITGVSRSSCVSSKLSDGEKLWCDRLVKVHSSSQSKLNYCKTGTAGASAKLASQNIIMGTMANEFRQCEYKFKKDASNQKVSASDIIKADCTSVANRSNPICRVCNADPKKAGCENVLTVKTPAQSNSVSVRGNILNDEPLDDATSDYRGTGTLAVDDIELAGPEFIAPNSDGSVESQGGGGTANFNGSSNSGFQNKTGSSTSPPAAAANTDILKGERGGSGYSPRRVSSLSGGGGFSGYGRNYKNPYDDGSVQREIKQINRKIMSSFDNAKKQREKGAWGLLLGASRKLKVVDAVKTARKKLGFKARANRPGVLGHMINMESHNAAEEHASENIAMIVTLFALLSVVFLFLILRKKDLI